MDQDLLIISCRHCKKPFPIKSFARHAETNSKCKQTYTQDQIKDLKSLSKEAYKAKKKLKDAARYQRKKAELAAKYIENKEQIAKQNAEKYEKSKRAKIYQEKKHQIASRYDKAKRAQNYQRNKFYISEKNRRNRVNTSLKYFKRIYGLARKYNKELRRKKYKLVMAKISRDRKELLKIMKSKAGKIFSEVFGYVVLDCYNEFESDNLDCSLGMQEKNRKDLEDEFHDEVFEKEEWIRKFNRKTFDCGEYKRFKRFHDSDVPLTCSELADQLSKESMLQSRLDYYTPLLERKDVSLISTIFPKYFWSK